MERREKKREKNNKREEIKIGEGMDGNDKVESRRQEKTQKN